MRISEAKAILTRLLNAFGELNDQCRTNKEADAIAERLTSANFDDAQAAIDQLQLAPIEIDDKFFRRFLAQCQVNYKKRISPAPAQQVSILAGLKDGEDARQVRLSESIKYGINLGRKVTPNELKRWAQYVESGEGVTEKELAIARRKRSLVQSPPPLRRTRNRKND